MRLRTIGVEEFSPQEEYGNPTINTNGETTVIHGPNRSGKTLTFCAIGYTILDTTWGARTGSGSKVVAEFSNGAEYTASSGGHQLRVGNEQHTGKEDTRDRLRDLVGSNRFLKHQFIHSQLSKLPLEGASSDVLTYVRQVVAPEVNEEITDARDERDRKQEQIEDFRDERTQIESRIPEIDNEIEQTKTEIEEEERIIELGKTGELDTIQNALEEDAELNEKLRELYEQRDELETELTRLRQRRDNSETGQSDAIVNVGLTCGVCNESVPVTEARRRVDSGLCPVCSRDTEFVVPRPASDDPDTSDDVDEAIADRESTLRSVEEQISELQSNRPELSELDGDIQRRLERHDREVDIVVQAARARVDELEERVESLEEQHERLESRLEQIDKRVPELKEERDRANEEYQDKQEEARDSVDAFEEKWEENFREMNSGLGLEVRLEGDRGVLLPGTPTRVYGQNANLSDAERLLLNISFGVTLHDVADEDQIALDTFVLDDPFVHLNEDGTRELLEFILDDERQYIITSSDETLADRVGQVTQLARQSGLFEFEDED